MSVRDQIERIRPLSPVVQPLVQVSAGDEVRLVVDLANELERWGDHATIGWRRTQDGIITGVTLGREAR